MSMGIEENNDATNPLFAGPMQLLMPEPGHNFLVPVPETMEALKSVNCPINIITGAPALPNPSSLEG